MEKRLLCHPSVAFKIAWLRYAKSIAVLAFFHKLSVSPACVPVNYLTASSPRQTIAPLPKHDNTQFDLSQSAVNTQVQGVLSPTRPQMTAVKRSRCEAHSPCAVAPQHTSPTRSRELEYAGPISFSRNCAQCIGRRRSSLHQPVCYSLTNF